MPFGHGGDGAVDIHSPLLSDVIAAAAAHTCSPPISKTQVSSRNKDHNLPCYVGLYTRDVILLISTERKE
jgi:hypothetical protein